MNGGDIDRYVTRSRALDVSDIPWGQVGEHPVAPEVVRTLTYMQDIERYTLMYLRQLLATRAVDDPDVATFLACWLYEETHHGRALARFLEAAGGRPVERTLSRQSLSQRVEQLATGFVARAWPDFVAVHMTWGAINELTTLTAYQRLARVADHPILSELLGRIMQDESRHFGFYYDQAERRLRRPGAARVTRWLVDHFWAPVGSGVQPTTETRFLADYLFSGTEGRAAAQRIDATIRRLVGFADAPLVEAWIDGESSVERSHPATAG